MDTMGVTTRVELYYSSSSDDGTTATTFSINDARNFASDEDFYELTNGVSSWFADMVASETLLSREGNLANTLEKVTATITQKRTHNY